MRPDSTAWIPRRFSRATGPALLVAGIASSSCGAFGLGTSEFVVRVDSITGPSTVAPTDTLVVRFRGPVGPDGCSRIIRVDKGRSPGLFEIRFIGERIDGQCTQQPVVLDHEERIVPPLDDPFTVRARQPDRTALDKVVRVQ